MTFWKFALWYIVLDWFFDDSYKYKKYAHRHGEQYAVKGNRGMFSDGADMELCQWVLPKQYRKELE